MVPAWIIDLLSFLAYGFIFLVGLGALFLVMAYAKDRFQPADAVLRNYPVVGRFRGLFSKLGEFFRQYFFAMDREEMPFNRAERDWVYRAAKGEGNTVPFGSTKLLTPVGTTIFVNCPYPVQEEDRAETPAMVIGPYAREPYEARSFFNISGMSYGALSKPAVRALSRGAAKAGIWLNTGEGALSPMHLEHFWLIPAHIRRR